MIGKIKHIDMYDRRKSFANSSELRSLHLKGRLAVKLGVIEVLNKLAFQAFFNNFYYFVNMTRIDILSLVYDLSWVGQLISASFHSAGTLVYDLVN